MILLKSIKVEKKGSKISKTRAREGGASVFTSFLSLKAAAPAKGAMQQAGKKEGDWGERPEGFALRPYGVKIFARLPGNPQRFFRTAAGS